MNARLDAMEQRARADYRNIIAERINGNVVEVTTVSAMINRGMATGDVKRAQWKLNGKRIGRAALLQFLGDSA